MSQYIYDLSYKKSIHGFILNTLSAFLFYFATVMVHKGLRINENSDAFLYAFYRYYLGCIFFLLIIFKKNIKISYQIPKSVLARGVFNSIAVLLFYFAIQLGETGRANVLNMTYPVFVAIISGPILKEYPKFTTIISLILCMFGISLYFYEPLLRLKDSFLFSDLLGLLSGITASFAIIALRGSAKEIQSEIILFWMFFIGVILILPFCYKNLFLLDKLDLFYLLTSGIMGVIGQWALTISYQYLNATTGSIISGLRIPIALIYGFIFLDETFSLLSWIGGFLIFFSNIIIAYKK